MRPRVVLLASAVLLAVSFAAAAGQPCRYSAPRNAEIDAAGLASLAVELGSNDLVIEGQPGLAKVVVRGTACASNQAWLPDIKVETARHGEGASLIADNGGHHIGLSLFGGSYAYLKLDVKVPEALAVKLQVGSGDASASRLAALDATLGSGDLKVGGVGGRFGLRVGSGDAEATDVGTLDLASVGSGDASVDGVKGDARVGAVGSGDLRLRQVQGNVTLGSVASGDARISGVGGGVRVQSVGSGDLAIHDTKQDVTVGSIASGDVESVQIGGNVHAGSVGSGDFSADGVGGDFSVGSLGSGDARHRNVKGRVSIPRHDD